MSVFYETAARNDWVSLLSDDEWTAPPKGRKTRLRLLLSACIHHSLITEFLGRIDLLGGDISVAERVYDELNQMPAIAPGVFAPLALLKALSTSLVGYQRQLLLELLLLSGSVSQENNNISQVKLEKAFQTTLALLHFRYPAFQSPEPPDPSGVYCYIKLFSGLANFEEAAVAIGGFLLALGYDWREEHSEAQKHFGRYLDSRKVDRDLIKSKCAEFEEFQASFNAPTPTEKTPILSIIVSANRAKISAKLYRHLPASFLQDGAGRKIWECLDTYDDSSWQAESDLMELCTDPHEEEFPDCPELEGLRRWLRITLWRAIRDLNRETDVTPHVRIEFILPDHLMNAPVDTWTILEPLYGLNRLKREVQLNGSAPHICIGQSHYVAVRNLTRLEIELENREEGIPPILMIERLKASPLGYYVCHRDPEVSWFYNTLSDARNADKAIFICAQTVQHNPDIWKVIHRLGIPYGIWARRPKQKPVETVCEALQRLVDYPPVKNAISIQDRVRKLRTGIIADDSSSLKAGVSLLYDDYSAEAVLPPMDYELDSLAPNMA